MELVEGETLAHRLARSALPVPEALRLGAQIADALDRAHRAGVVHRDLKPGNVMLARSGAKLMDFGLARPAGLADPLVGPATAGPMTSPTMTMPLTAEGTLLGTFQYMAPEQLEGKDTDHRADLWALGCVVYEMVTGRAAFEGGTQASLVSAIMRDTPRPMAELVPMSPPALQRLVEALLAKDPEERLQTAHDAKLHLQWLMDSASGSTARAPAGEARPRRRPSVLAWSVAALSLTLAFAAWLSRLGPAPEPSGPRMRLTAQPPPSLSLFQAGYRLAISPDGRAVAFVASDGTATSRIYVRDLADLTTRVLEGTDHADQPFWSPDGRWLGYFAHGKLRKIAVSGGVSEAIANAPDARGGSWGSSGIIVFAPAATGGLFAVSADGGDVTELLRPDTARGETGLRFPEFLPDGQSFLFVSMPRNESGFEVSIGRVGLGERRPVMRASSAPAYVEPGYLITSQGAHLVAQPFDARSGELTGDPITLGTAPPPTWLDGGRVASASSAGILAYWSGTLANTRLHWLDRSGRRLGELSVPVGRWERILISPDGLKAIVEKVDTNFQADIWIVDLQSGRASPLTFGPFLLNGFVWSPDGRRVAYVTRNSGLANLYIQPVEGGKAELLYTSESGFLNPYSWSPDGEWISLEQPHPETSWDLWALLVRGERKPVPVERRPASEGGGWFSPDGRFIAFYSNESGKYETFVRSFPQAGERVLIPGSAVGGSEGGGPLWWSHDGKEVLFLAGRSVRVSSVAAGSGFVAGPARELFTIPEGVLQACPTPDLQRILVAALPDDAPAPAIVIDQNWTVAPGAK